MSQREVWDRLAVQWARFRHKPQEAVGEFMRGRKGLVLDAGCGAGRNLVKGNFVAFDFSGGQISLAGKKLIYRDDIDFVRADAKAMPFRDGKFSAALLVAVLHCMYREEQEAALRELNRVLKPGSEVLVTVWNRRQPKFLMKKKESFVDWRLGEHKLRRYYYLFTKSELRKLLEKHGFRVLDIRGSEKKESGFSSDIIAKAKKC
jgi:ubiquinone/menaquinone biosynthesis C-methylase UbiE